jgi:hypothetical protein
LEGERNDKRRNYCSNNGKSISRGRDRASRNVQDEVARLNTEKNKGFCRVNDLVYQKIREEVGHGLSEHAAAVIFNYAYESKHAYGFYAVRQELESLIELVSEILKEQKQIRRNK